MLVSVVIRTLNEEAYLRELLVSISGQVRDNFDVELVVIDSGSSDRTLEIAKLYDARITHITKDEFTFGRSLNLGSEFSQGEILVYISGHCVPTRNTWLVNLIRPLREGMAGYSYGRQVGRDTTKYSERKIFSKYFSSESKLPQKGFFCNNANSAILRRVWANYKFDEEITGLEDMELAKRYCEQGGKIAYLADAEVYHIHDESWGQTRRRYEREAIALQKIMPEVQVTVIDMIRYIGVSVVLDLQSALRDKSFMKEALSIVKFRVAQYVGTYSGNHDHRELSKKRKENYFYPNKTMQS